MKKTKKIIIVGAGLCGTLLAIRLAQRGFNICLYEKRSDMRNSELDAGRSINLALSARGLMALERANLKSAVLKDCIPMRGRMIHPVEGDAFLSPYSGRSEDYINSVSRPGLNIILLNQASEYDNIEIKFDAPVIDVDLKSAKVRFKNNHDQMSEDQGDIVIGTDGAGSAVRKSMMKHTTELLFNYSQHFLSHGYKELSIHPDKSGEWKIEKEALHIWPRGNFMVIALPNLDGSFTLTMFHPFEGNIGFKNLNTDKKVAQFFEEHYPSLLPHVPHLKEEYASNPIGTLGTIKCAPWQAFDKALIMGDAAHAIVPFYGQGMNASLEDVKVFDDILEEYGDNWSKVFPLFQEARKENADAIADLAIDNFYEMRDHVDDQAFIQKRKIEMQLEQTYSDYYSKYSLVTFRPDLSYSQAKILGRKQDQLLLNICKNENTEQIPLHEIHSKLRSIQA